MRTEIKYLILILIFGIAAVALYSRDDMVGGNMMVAVLIGLAASYIVREIMFKDNMKKDEMVKKISGMSSDIALFISVISVGALTLILYFHPNLLDAFEVLAIILAVMMVSKITLQLYYTKMKDDIGF
ncbi:DUF2178 domain-containing protein [uncultured Methanolobus sp.]|uniref:DUF2178 domain-containing protein n=1 Tax=uncultured Methanolobus sp. TaxID=218300 RepID=UPI002AAB2B9D|nr:hypothetical protein [uncultured Methanolobus sp.]